MVITSTERVEIADISSPLICDELRPIMSLYKYYVVTARNWRDRLFSYMRISAKRMNSEIFSAS